MALLVGLDWGEEQHRVLLMSPEGDVLDEFDVEDSISGLARVHTAISACWDDPGDVMVGAETDRGLLIEALVASDYQVYVANPKSVTRYRDRHAVSGAKSDRGDARVLADMVRTDHHLLRRAGGDSELVTGLRVLTRAHKNLIWDRQRYVNRLRSSLKHYYPQALETFGTNLAHRDALAVLSAAPTPEQGKRLTPKRIETLLRKGGRLRGVASKAADIHQTITAPGLQSPPAVASARAATTRTSVHILTELNQEITRLEQEISSCFSQHPDANIILSLPGAGETIGPRVLAEFGDDPNRYSDAKSRRNYAATSPITIQSGKHRTVQARSTKNDWLADALDRWAFAALKHSPGARRYYQEQIAKNKTHGQALRALANRLVGILHGCLTHQQPYDETIAWNRYQQQAA